MVTGSVLLPVYGKKAKSLRSPLPAPEIWVLLKAGKLGQMVVVVGRGALAIPVGRVPVIRAWLDHPFRHDGGGIDIAQPIGADQGINILQHLQGDCRGASLSVVVSSFALQP